MPAEIRKILERFPRVSNEMVDRAQGEQRRCQVFDAATLDRRGELYQKACEGGAAGWRSWGRPSRR